MWVHFISIGGSVMHQLAIALKKKGYHITGSDDEIFEPAFSNLQAEGILPREIGWNADNIVSGIDVVILGMHAKEDNPELKKARKLPLTIYSFPEYIFEESRNKTRVAIGGSHGKTTVTAMIMHAMKMAKRDFDYLVGARLAGFDQSVQITAAPVIICEADEYPASTLERRPKFHFLYPHIAVITGLAWDHINVFPTFEFYREQFIIFINKIEKDGILIYNESDAELDRLIAENKREDIRYKGYSLPEFEIIGGCTTVRIGAEKVKLHVFGEHNLLNLQAAWLVCQELKMNDAIFAGAIADFRGAAKRLELIFSAGSTNVYRDFAHAPSKVRASIEAVREQFPQRKLVAVLELHTFSSLNVDFMPEYRAVMEVADVAIVFYSDHALQLKRMKPLPEREVIEGFDKKGLLLFNQRNELEESLRSIAKENTNFLFMSSGNYEEMDILKTLNLR